MPEADRRILLVHAHPDDETINTGATMASYASQGAHVTLLTCTLGEEGEILVPELAGLEAAQADQLGGYRIGELASALQELGVTDHRFLGGAGTFRDSGMVGSKANDHPRAFVRANREAAVFARAVAEAVDVILDVRPQVVITYDPTGGYGHPDHVLAHRVTMAAVTAAAAAGWQVAKTYWVIDPDSVLRQGIDAVVAKAPQFKSMSREQIGTPGHPGVPDVDVTTRIDASAFVEAKTRALTAHQTQVTVARGFFALSNYLGRPISGIEYYRLASGATERGELETDLFAGIDG